MLPKFHNPYYKLVNKSLWLTSYSFLPDKPISYVPTKTDDGAFKQPLP